MCVGAREMMMMMTTMSPFCCPHFKYTSRVLKIRATITRNPETTINLELQSPKDKKNSRVLVLGGTGRVGGSTAIALSKLCPQLQIIIAGRNKERGSAMVDKLGDSSKFTAINIDDFNMLHEALIDVDLVVHCAGPFQQAQKCAVLEAAIQTKVRERPHMLMCVMTQATLTVPNLTWIKQPLQAFLP